MQKLAVLKQQDNPYRALYLALEIESRLTAGTHSPRHSVRSARVARKRTTAHQSQLVESVQQICGSRRGSVGAKHTAALSARLHNRRELL